MLDPAAIASYLRAEIFEEHRLRTTKTIDEGALARKPSAVDLPRNWEWLNTAQIFYFVTSGSRGWAKYYSDHGAIFIRIGNLDHDSINLDLRSIQFVEPPDTAEARRTRIARGDILVSITADVGMTALVDSELGEAYMNQHVALARAVSPVDKKYVAYCLTSDLGQEQFRELQRGATKVGLGLDDIRNVWVGLPTLDEQNEIVRRVEELFKFADAVEERFKKAKAHTDKLTQSILAKAFRGELVPQDPTDEPASVLLERIKGQKAK